MCRSLAIPSGIFSGCIYVMLTHHTSLCIDWRDPTPALNRVTDCARRTPSHTPALAARGAASRQAAPAERGYRTLEKVKEEARHVAVSAAYRSDADRMHDMQWWTCMMLINQVSQQQNCDIESVTGHSCYLQDRASDELYSTRERIAEEILKAESVAAQDTEKVTGLYRGYARSPYDHPAAPTGMLSPQTLHKVWS